MKLGGRQQGSFSLFIMERCCVACYIVCLVQKTPASLFHLTFHLTDFAREGQMKN